MTRDTLPMVGDAFAGFGLRHELGRGGSARVYIAEPLASPGATSVLKIAATTCPHALRLVSLRHRNIMPVDSYFEIGGLHVLVMPHLDGTTLSEAIRARWLDDAPSKAGMPVGEAASIVAGLADGLQYAHEHGVLHRDVKPSNIFLAVDGRALLLDFGVSTSPAAPTPLGGTAAYMAPEHLRAMASADGYLSGAVDARSDIYSLGLVLFEMVAGHLPFDPGCPAPSPALMQAMAAQRSFEAPSLRFHRPDVPGAFERIVRQALAPDPARRYQQAGQLAADLRSIQSGGAGGLRRWARRRLWPRSPVIAGTPLSRP